MTTHALALIILSLAAPAYADVSDSGNLTIAGQGVIQGTMTVQGSAFSVGGSTFIVAGGSITLGGRLNLGADGIKWPSGAVTTSTSDFGGVGNFVNSGDNTTTGANTNDGSWTSGANSTFTILGVSNACIEISSADVVGVSSFTFSGLSSSFTYKLEWTVKMTSAAPWLALIVNNDKNANYKDSANVLWNSGNYLQTSGTYGHSLYFLNGNNCAVGDTGSGTTTIRTNHGGTRTMIYTQANWEYTAGSSGATLTSGTTYNSGTPISISVVGTTGAYSVSTNRLAYYTAHLELWRCGYRSN